MKYPDLLELINEDAWKRTPEEQENHRRAIHHINDLATDDSKEAFQDVANLMLRHTKVWMAFGGKGNFDRFHEVHGAEFDERFGRFLGGDDVTEDNYLGFIEANLDEFAMLALTIPDDDS